MAIRNGNEIGPNRTITPEADQGRVNKVVDNRRLWNGDFVELMLQSISQTQGAVQINYFRRVVEIYAEFMFNERPIIRGVPDEVGESLMEFIQMAFVDALRYGEGMVASHALDPTQFVVQEPDMWFSVVDEQGIVTEDILIDITGDGINFKSETKAQDQVVNVIRQKVDGESSWQQYSFSAGNIGPLLRSFDIPQRAAMRQVVPLYLNRQHDSIQNDIKSPVTQLMNIQTAIARTIKRNANPHLIGPDDMLTRNAKGQVEIDENGMFLSTQSGDVRPAYLQWESKVEAQDWQTRTLMNAMFNLTGLSETLFNPDALTGTQTGEALKRGMLPFVSKTGSYARTLEQAMKRAVLMNLANRQSVGQPVPQASIDTLDVEWTYEAIWRDENGEATATE